MGIKNCIGQGWGGGAVDCPCGMGVKNCIGQGLGGGVIVLVVWVSRTA